MNSTVNEITKSITGKFSLFECEINELQQLTTQYPFFGPAKFLLAKKLKEEHSPLLAEHIDKTSLYFQNPVWFDHLLNDTGTGQKYKTIKKEDPGFVPTTDIETPATHEEVVDQTKIETADDNMTEEEPGQGQPELSFELRKFKFEPIDPSKAGLTFEPYHTIDYFASLGIRAKEEEKPKDQLSRQLKSFTEWLKVMKRLPVSELAASVSATDEKKVEKMAETSINDREVVTEAMAEVWEKQGNTSKANDIYQKLSLLNPAKSSYFAAKIEQLKNL
ncbi:MAG: hypothetical protein ACXWWD_13955 [Chitinophagaceae bacterium]